MSNLPRPPRPVWCLWVLSVSAVPSKSCAERTTGWEAACSALSKLPSWRVSLTRSAHAPLLWHRPSRRKSWPGMGLCSPSEPLPPITEPHLPKSLLPLSLCNMGAKLFALCVPVASGLSDSTESCFWTLGCFTHRFYWVESMSHWVESLKCEDMKI